MAKGWIKGDESAKEMLVRVLTERPLLLLSPLHRVPLRVGNVVEIVGPSPSAKTQILIQAAISCILPKDWKGVHYGGLERLVMFVDLDCRFEIQRLLQSLKCRIIEANRLRVNETREQDDVNVSNSKSKERDNDYDRELIAVCMRRFLYIRCYDSVQFLATLKTMHYQLQKERKAHGIGVHLLMIDSACPPKAICRRFESWKQPLQKKWGKACLHLPLLPAKAGALCIGIGAFYWIDRASASLPIGGPNRKIFSLQSVSETVVQEIQKLLLVHPMLVLATKASNLVDKHSTNDVKRAPRNWSAQNASYLRSNPQNLSYREYMPSVWQSFVTHRVLVRALGDDRKHGNHPIYLSEWLLPSLNISDKFIVREAGIYIVP